MGFAKSQQILKIHNSNGPTPSPSTLAMPAQETVHPVLPGLLCGIRKTCNAIALSKLVHQPLNVISSERKSAASKKFDVP